MTKGNHQNIYAISLTLLLGVFVFRVCAQLLQFFYPIDFLPAFDRWHSGALPYPVLVGFQLVIIAACVKVVIGFFKEKAVPSSQKGKIFTALGAVYFFIMIGRLTIGITYPEAHSWFLVKIPTVFHLVLASFLLVLAHYHLKFSKAQS